MSYTMKNFLKDMIERAIKTFAQGLIASIATGAAFSEISWGYVFSVAGVAALVSILTSIASFNIGDYGTASVVEQE